MINTNLKDNCAICENEFYKEKMIDGKCDACNVRFPGIKSKAELDRKREEENNEEMNKGNLANIIQDKVNKMMKDYGVLQECECGNLYYRRSPAQKSCGCTKE